MKYLSDTQAIVKVQQGRRVTIPKKFRDALGWKAGDVLEYVPQDDGSVLLRKVV